MTPPLLGRPPYRLAFCPRAEADLAGRLRADVRASFSDAELAEISALPERRRRDRVAGRLAAKRALADHFLDEHDWDPDAAELEIFNDASGRAALRLPAGAPAPAPSFSISHCPAGAVCAVAARGRFVGADIETIVSRPAEVLAFVSRPAELDAAPPSDPEAQARLWTGKEAALKLLGLGLEADARDAVVLQGEAVYAGRPAEAWRALGSPRVRLAYERADDAMAAVAYTGD